MAARRIERPVNAKTITRPGADPGRDAAENPVGAACEREAGRLAVAFEQAEPDAGGVRQIERRHQPVRRDADAEFAGVPAHAARRPTVR